MATIPLTTKAILSTTFINAFDLCNGRLTLTSGTPVTTTDVTAATTVYWTPYKGSYVAIYNGTQWLTYQFSQLSLALTGTSTCIDIFISISGGVPVLSLLTWGSTTTRATGLVLQNGVYVLSGTTTKRYLGTIYMNGSSQTSDSIGGRYVWNYYNRIEKSMSYYTPISSWVCPASQGIRQANASSLFQLNYAIGVIEDMTKAQITLVYNSASAQYSFGFGLNSTTTYAGASTISYISTTSSGQFTASVFFMGYSSGGLNSLSWNEATGTTNTQTIYGVSSTTNFIQSGMAGTILC